MNELVVSEINSDMGITPAHGIVKNQIARLKLILADFLTDLAQFQRSSRQCGSPCFLENITDKTTAVDAGLRGIPAIFVMRTDQCHSRHGQLGRLVGEMVNLLHRRSGSIIQRSFDTLSQRLVCQSEQ